MTRNRNKKPPSPLDKGAIERLALHYVGRYATTRAKLTAYLHRKLAERGWSEEHPPEIDRLIERFSEVGYIDDAAFATARAASLQRRGYGERRVAQALKAAGIDEEDAAEARGMAAEESWAAALRFAQRKRIGPYASQEVEGKARDRAFAAMARAGHRIEYICKVLACRPGEIPDVDKL